MPRIPIPLQTLRSRPISTRSSISTILLTATLFTIHPVSVSSGAGYTLSAHVCNMADNQYRYNAFNPISISGVNMTITTSSTESPSTQPQAPPKIKFLLDFDSTLTTSDTLSTLSQLSKSSKPWNFFVEKYLDDVRRLVPPPPAPSPSAPGHTTIKQELEYLEEYFLAEKMSIERLEGEKFFAGLRSGKAEKDGKGEIWMFGRDVAREGKVKVREGWWEVEEWLVGRGRRREIEIVSVNWSKEFISGVVDESYSLWEKQRMWKERKEEERVEDEEAKEEPSTQKQQQPMFRIHSNDFLVSLETGLTTGKFSRRPLPSIDRGIWTAGDKLEVMEEILRSGNRDRDGNIDENIVTIYVGDSSKDLGCLLRADVGIVVGGDEELKATFERLGLRVEEGMGGRRRDGVGSGRGSEQVQKGGKGKEGELRREKRLFRVKDFWEVLKWLETLDG